MTLVAILLIIAILLFVIDAFRPTVVAGLNLTALGLAFFAAAFLVGKL